MDIENLTKQSPRNLKRFVNILEIIVDELELQVPNRTKGNDIPWKYFQKLGYFPNTVLAFLKLLKNEYQANFIIWNGEKEWLRLHLEPVYNKAFEDGVIQSWTNRKIKAEINKRAYEVVVKRVEENLVLGINKEQLISLKEILAILRAKIPDKKNAADTIPVNKPSLVDVIPIKGQHEVLRRIARLYADRNRVDNWKIASAIHPTVPPSGRKFAKKDYDRQTHNPEIRNRFITLRKLWKPYISKINRYRDYTEIIRT